MSDTVEGLMAEACAAMEAGGSERRVEAQERRRPLADGTSLVLRWMPGRHSNPEYLEATAESLVETVADFFDRPPGLEDGATIAYGWSLLTVRQQGKDRILCEPAFTTHPLHQLADDLSFTLHTLVMQDVMMAIVKAEPSACLCMDLIAVERGALAQPRVVMTRLAEREEEISGWVVGPSSSEAIDRMLEREDYVMVPTAMIATERPHLLKALLMPPGWVVTFEDHAVTSVRDAQGRERFATE